MAVANKGEFEGGEEGAKGTGGDGGGEVEAEPDQTARGLLHHKGPFALPPQGEEGVIREHAISSTWAHPAMPACNARSLRYSFQIAHHPKPLQSRTRPDSPPVQHLHGGQAAEGLGSPAHRARNAVCGGRRPGVFHGEAGLVDRLSVVSRRAEVVLQLPGPLHRQRDDPLDVARGRRRSSSQPQLSQHACRQRVAACRSDSCCSAAALSKDNGTSASKLQNEIEGRTVEWSKWGDRAYEHGFGGF